MFNLKNYIKGIFTSKLSNKILLNVYDFVMRTQNNLKYDKKIVLENGIIHIKNSFGQHRVIYLKNDGGIELRSSKLIIRKLIGTSTYVIKDRVIQPIKNYYFPINTIFIEITMEKRIKNIKKCQENNMPQEIKVLNENKDVVLRLIFNEFGFIVKVIDESKK
ncbi:MAG: hypothetical protein RR523_14855 [Cetobacterium sp.]|uniref:hypothetical protein n=1 Tax=Cetobacterium sp. TaxID=2071632 RepID=UPI002FC65B66